MSRMRTRLKCHQWKDVGLTLARIGTFATSTRNWYVTIGTLATVAHLLTISKSAMQKTDAIIEANPGVSLDELVATRKINADQKASAEKKPGLQAQRAQLEEQFGHFQKYGQEQDEKFAREKEILKKAHSSELDALRDTLKAEAVLEQKKLLKEKILTLSRFLRAAAARRQLEDDDSDLTKAFEGALLQVYGGDATAVLAAEKLIDGAEEGVPSTEGILLSVTCMFTSHIAQDPR